MRIQIDGQHNTVSDKELRSAAQFFARHLFTKQTNKKVKVTIEFDNIGGSIYNGFCEYLDRKDRPRSFLIGIRKTLPRSTAIRVLAHEMVHAWQYATGHMYDLGVSDGNEGTKWRGRKFNSDRISYWDSPWEIDAFGREVGLYARYSLWKSIMDKHKKIKKENKTKR